MNKTNKYVVITSIFNPTEAVKKFAAIEDWQVIVVGDKKTPQDWRHQGVIYLSPEDQIGLGFETSKFLPWNHYCRKLIGYLFAIKNGAELIADTDDDNLPNDDWPSLPNQVVDYKILSGGKFTNIYKYFTDEFIWPRGLPLDYILADEKAEESTGRRSVAIWQFLANGDPDVDAIYRLTNNKPLTFNGTNPVVLDKGLISPFNSQNTIFTRDFFGLLYLPAFVTFRFTDILRGLVAQPILWQHGHRLGFAKATVTQERNPHDYIKDFESEIPVYLHAEKVVDIASKVTAAASQSIDDSLIKIYEALEKEKIVEQAELKLLKAWLSDLNKLVRP